jgi:hypothetical protein
MKLSTTRETTSCEATQHVMKPEGSLPHSQELSPWLCPYLTNSMELSTTPEIPGCLDTR